MNLVNQTPAQPAEKEQAMPNPTLTALPSRVKDLTGRIFGRLTVIGFSHFVTYQYEYKAIRVPHWECECNCGNIAYVCANSLIMGRTMSCGCYRKEGGWRKRAG